MFEPTDVANEALDAAGIEYTLGDLGDGSRFANVLARRFRPTLAALLRAARWEFARRQQQMQILGDTTGQYAPTTPGVIPPWVYEYAYPNDCVGAHFVPHLPGTQLSPVPPGNIAIPSTPLMTNFSQNNWTGHRLHPARFLIARDVNYPPQPGSEWEQVQGQSPMGQTVVLTNVPCATLVYTSLVLTPSEWSVDFREAFVALLAAEICLPLNKDKKFAITLRRELAMTAKEKITQARITDGNETWSVNDHIPDWLSFRNTSLGRGNFGGGEGGAGYLYQGYGSITFPGDSAAF